jgi:hypothetical protein
MMAGASDYLAGGAALLAALLSAASLVLTRRWQQDQHQEEVRSQTKAWILENLKNALIDHINLSFKIGRACRDGYAAKDAADVDRLRESLERATQMHVEYLDLMVYLRLFASVAVVRAAERLHLSLDNLIDLTFSEELRRQGREPFTHKGQPPSGVTLADARRRCMDQRESLINEVREYLGLPKDAVIDRTI